MRYSSELIENIKAKNDIVDVIGERISLTQKGNSFLSLCPFHDDSNPSMSVLPSKQIFKCFSCGTGGNVIKFIQLYDKVTFNGALKILAERAAIDVDFEEIEKPTFTYTDKQKRLISCLSDATKFYRVALLENPDALAYLKQRNIDIQIINEFEIGYADGNKIIDYLKKLNYTDEEINQASLTNVNDKPILWNRIFFPIRDEYGYVVGFSARTLGDDVKYINSKETAIFKKSHILYNYNRVMLANDNVDNELYITEGFMDVIAFYRAGLTNAVALMGTALTENHISLLTSIKKVHLFLDGDKAGLLATFHSLDLLIRKRIMVDVIVNKTPYDPDELINKLGKKDFIETTKNTKSGIDWMFDHLVSKYKLSDSKAIISSAEKIAFVKEFGKYLEFQSKDIYDLFSNIIKNDFKIDIKSFVTKKSSNDAQLKEKKYFVEQYNEKQYENAPQQHNELSKQDNNYVSVKIQLVLMLFISLYPQFRNLLISLINKEGSKVEIPFSDNYLDNYLKVKNINKIENNVNRDQIQQDELDTFKKMTIENLKQVLKNYQIAKEQTNIFSIFYEVKNSDLPKGVILDSFKQLYLRSLIEKLGDEVQNHLQYLKSKNHTLETKNAIFKKIVSINKRREIFKKSYNQLG